MSAKSIILAVNLGSPEAPRTREVRTYLREFLMDGNVIDVPRPIRDLIVKGFILPFRPKKSAEAYAAIWTDEGSPLIVNTYKLVEKMQPLTELPIVVAMRYGSPSIAGAIEKSVADYPELENIILLPLYPHYAMSTVGTVQDLTRDIVRKNYPQLNVEVVKPFYDLDAYISVLAESIKSELDEDAHLLFSYHGLPVRHLKKTDITGNHCYKVANCCSVKSEAHQFCYKHQVLETTRLVVEKLGLKEENYSIGFQSRLGSDEWIAPATTDQVAALAAKGIKKLAVACPAFVSDCLETLEEIGIGEEEAFLEAGGESFKLIPCLNDNLAFANVMVDEVNKVV